MTPPLPRRLVLRWGLPGGSEQLYVRNEDYEDLEALWLWIVDRYPRVARKATDAAGKKASPSQ